MTGERVSEALLSYANKMCSILAGAEESAAQDLELFINNHLGAKLGPAIPVFTELLKQLKIDSWEKLETIVKNHFKHVSVQDAFEEVVEVEQRWNNFLAGLDHKLISDNSGQTLQCGDKLISDISLVNARSGNSETVQSLLSSSQEFVHFVLLRHFA